MSGAGGAWCWGRQAGGLTRVPLLLAGTEEVQIDNESWNITRFATTPKMSTYLLAFIVSEFTEVSNNSEEVLVSRARAPCTQGRAQAAPEPGTVSPLRFASGAAPKPLVRVRVPTRSR